MNFIKNKKNTPFIVFSVMITVFFLAFSKFMVKTDDGHFMGIMSENGYNIFEWLKYRYNNISGRTVCEFLTMTFLAANPIFIKLFYSALWIILVYLLLKIVSAYSDGSVEEKIFVCSIPFSVFIACLNAGALWYSGGFTYFVPLVFMAIGLSPLVFDVLDVKYNKFILAPASVIFAYMSSSQEQAAALTVTFLLVLLFILIKNKKAKFYHFLPLVSAAVETYLLFSSPGIRKRSDMESCSFEVFNSFGIIKKFLCGFSNYIAFEFFMSLFVSGLFIFLLICTLKRLYGKNRLSIVLTAVWGTVCVLLNGIYIIVNRAIPDKGFEKAIKNGTFTILDILLIAGGALLLLCIVTAIIMIIKKEFKTGFTVLLCYSAGVCSGLMLGFSSSIYASGQRVFFFSEMFTLIAGAFLFASLDNGKLRKKISQVILTFSIIMFCVNCLAFTYMEYAIMG